MSADDCKNHVQRDVAFALPYDIAALDAEERDRRTKISRDLCHIDEQRFFLRGVLEVPVHDDADEPLRFGVWAEVENAVVARYIELYRVDARDETPALGKLANAIRGYPDLLGHPLVVRFSTAKERPRLLLDPSDHPLAIDQRDGIGLERLELIVHRALSRAVAH